MCLPFQKKQILCLVIGTLIGSLAGCGGGKDRWTDARPKTVKAAGTVQYQGQPVPQATLTFTPATHEGQGAVAVTDDSGNFQLMTFEPGDGAIPGRYRVTAVKFPAESALSDGPSDSNEAPVAKELKSSLPTKYSRPATTDLEIEISSDAKANEKILIELKD